MELKDIKSLSDKRIADLKKLGIYSVSDLIKNFPRSYLDMSKVVNLRDAYHNEIVLTVAKIETAPVTLNAGKMKYVKVYCSQPADNFSVIWFNQPYVATKLKAGEEYFFYGRVSKKFGQTSMTNPTFEEVSKNYKLKGIVPVYSVRGNLTQSVMKYATLNAVKSMELSSVIPEDLQKKYALAPLKQAYCNVHCPESQNSLNNASERIAIEEYFSMITAFKIIKGDKKCVRTQKYNLSTNELVEFTKSFKFEFTNGQKSAVNEIYKDMLGPTVMNRLLQGDVGSGKTAVSVCALYIALKSGYQASFLAPTEVLAKQNYELAKRYLSEFNIAFLSGSLTLKEKREVKAKILNKEYDLVVGTHAVIQESVEFKNLALCVCDEQQRFGVKQRSALKDKGQNVDMLCMSATPIPRTLSLVFYGDLDVSTISDKPVMRAEIQTGIVPEEKYEGMLEFIKREIDSGKRAYFVCPKIEGDDEGTLISVKEKYEELSSYYKGYGVGLLNGKMKDSEKLEVMNAFKNGQTQILVSTTVIEVGVDVPEATVMVIYNAERFGLSQLHQLRGRVGRSNLKSYCFLIAGKQTETSIQRLNAVRTCSDGFKISEIDFDIRGGGDFLGERQAGRFVGTLGGLKYSSNAIFFAKKLSDEAFTNENSVKKLNLLVNEYYSKLKDITLN